MDRRAAAERVVPRLPLDGAAPASPGADSYLRYLAHRGLVRALVPAFDAATQRYAARAWDPALRFAEEALGAHLPAVTGILPAATSPAALAALKDRADGYDDWRLAVLGHATAVTTSAVLAFLLCEGVLSGEEIFAASRIDETWQAEHWGEDSEAAERAEVLRTELVACARLLAAL